MKGDIAKIACRILAIYALIVAITTFTYPLSIINQLGFAYSALYDSIFRMIFMVILAFLVPLALIGMALVLWFFADKIAGLMAGKKVGEGDGTSFVAVDIQKLAFLVAGVFVLASAVPGLFEGLMGVFGAGIGIFGRIVGLFGAVLKVAIGLWMVAGAQGINNITRIFNKGQQ